MASNYYVPGNAPPYITPGLEQDVAHLARMVNSGQLLIRHLQSILVKHGERTSGVKQELQKRVVNRESRAISLGVLDGLAGRWRLPASLFSMKELWRLTSQSAVPSRKARLRRPNPVRTSQTQYHVGAGSSTRECHKLKLVHLRIYEAGTEATDGGSIGLEHVQRLWTGSIDGEK